MEYKKCEHCGEKLHIRSKKCPFCNSIIEETALVLNDDDTAEQTEENDKNTKVEPTINIAVGEDVKDYIYKAEVRHSLEYTKPLSNMLKVFISAFSTFPMIGQIVGGFFGVFFLTYEDNDRKTFGRALIILSVIMFLLYMYSATIFNSILESTDMQSIMNQMKR